MTDVGTLQKKLEYKAHARARADASHAVGDLGLYSSGELVIQPRNDTAIKLDIYLVLQALEKRLEQRLYARYLAEETQNLLAAVEAVKQLGDEVAELQERAAS